MGEQRTTPSRVVRGLDCDGDEVCPLSLFARALFRFLSYITCNNPPDPSTILRTGGVRQALAAWLINSGVPLPKRLQVLRKVITGNSANSIFSKNEKNEKCLYIPSSDYSVSGGGGSVTCFGQQARGAPTPVCLLRQAIAARENESTQKNRAMYCRDGDPPPREADGGTHTPHPPTKLRMYVT